MNDCPCGSGQAEARCCGPFLDGAPAPTAEALMRSRYTAYVRGAVDYLMATHAAAKDDERAAIEKWSRESRWQSLEILATERGDTSDDQGVVEFIARGSSGGKPFAHHERSRFGRVDGRWLYLDGDRPRPAPARREATPGRNDSCPCGSGKKYKKCHGKSG